MMVAWQKMSSWENTYMYFHHHFRDGFSAMEVRLAWLCMYPRHHPRMLRTVGCRKLRMLVYWYTASRTTMSPRETIIVMGRNADMTMLPMGSVFHRHSSVISITV